MEEHPTSGPSASTSVGKKWSKYMTESTKLCVGPPACYQLKVKKKNLDRESDEKSKLRKFTLGKCNLNHQNRTILLVGETGSGKSTLINALVNFVMGVKFEDKVWFKIIPDETDRPQSESQTSEVSVYEVFGFEGTVVPYSLTIIDTPGFGDTRGIEHDKITTKKLLELFKAPDEVSGVKSIDAVGLVLKSSQNRINERIAYVFNSITSSFGKDMKKNIVAMMTHSDGGVPKDALKALEAAGVKYARDEDDKPVYFLFNNRQEDKIEKGEEAESFSSDMFKKAERGMVKFTKFLEKSQPQSLEKTKDVLIEREILTACIENLKERVAHIEIQQEAIKMNKEEVEKLDQVFSNIIVRTEPYKEKEHCEKKHLSCTRCKERCCNECVSPSKTFCGKISFRGYCSVCSGKCHQNDHALEKWKYVTKTRQLPEPVEEVQKRYNAKTESEVKKILLEELEKEMKQLQRDKDRFLDDAFEAIEKLEKIALNADSVSTYVHLDFLIEKMKERRDTEKVMKLEKMKENIKTTSKGGASYLERHH
ncbi:uncharacterized protein [Eucyclogobius newberryi]|uniref:uncharacterized protein n=1 Tax=Eucyclogobius newberryi TaxID=166745 RepID=UPI003B5CD542